MKQKNKTHILFRYLLLISFTFLFVAFIIYKLVGTTVTNAEKWEQKADKCLSQEKVVRPERGTIYSCDGAILAVDCEYVTVVMNPNANNIDKDFIRENLNELCDTLASIFPSKSSSKWMSDINKKLNEEKTTYYCINRITKPEDFQRLRKLPLFKKKIYRNFIYSTPIVYRPKPFGEMASNSIGEVMTLKDGSRRGVRGLEMALDSLLYGKEGRTQMVQMTNKIINYETKPSVRGYDVVTTIDVEMQDIVDDELEKMCIQTEPNWGCAILMEVETGEIKAMSNIEWDEKSKKYISGAINALRCYEPGSVIKPISMLIALEDGIVDDIDAVMKTGHSYKVGRARPITDGGHGSESMKVRSVIERSSNVGMARIIMKKYADHPEKFRDRLEEIGFFDKFNSGIGGERVPRFAKLKYRTEREKSRAQVELSRMCFGYASEIPPLYTVALYNAIANDGKFVRPHLVKKLMRKGEQDSIIPITYVRNQICSPENAKKLRTMLHDVVWGKRGTGRVLKDDRVELSGKTGTCNVVENGQYIREKKVNRYTFCGFFPYDKPKYSCIVVLSKAKNTSAGRGSGMVMKNIALRLYARGLLCKNPDFRTEEVGDKTARSVVYNIASSNEINRMKDEMNISNVVTAPVPNEVQKGTVPSVIGMNLRDAINKLEEMGLNVKIQGDGYVTEQSIEPGSVLISGKEILLTLSL